MVLYTRRTHVGEGFSAADRGKAPSDSVLISHPDPIVVVDRDGLGVAVKAALTGPQGGALIAQSDVGQQVGDNKVDGMNPAWWFQQLATDLPVPLALIDVQGRLLHANQQWCDAIGDRGHRGTVQRKWTDAIDGAGRAAATAALQAVVRGRQPLNIELRLKDAEGRYRPWACTLAPRFGQGEEIEECICICHDITLIRDMPLTPGEVARKLVAAQEVERARIARELHDDVGQQVALLATQLDALTAADFARQLEEARSTLHGIAGSLNNLSHRLHPGKVRLLGIATTLEGLCRDMGAENGVQINFASRGVPRDLAEDSGVSLFRVAQESLRNAVKHSGATTIVVRLVGARSHVVLRVSDNGKGFDPLTSRASGIGLLTMRERAELVNGTLVVEHARPHGTTVRMVVPVVTTQPMISPPSRPVVASPRPVRSPRLVTPRPPVVPPVRSSL
jgi:signal transduction histidine kinase